MSAQRGERKKQVCAQCTYTQTHSRGSGRGLSESATADKVSVDHISFRQLLHARQLNITRKIRDIQLKKCSDTKKADYMKVCILYEDYVLSRTMMNWTRQSVEGGSRELTLQQEQKRTAVYRP